MRARHTQHPATLREVFTATFPAGPVDDDASFVELGGDSLTFVRVAADVERVLGHPAGLGTHPAP